MQLDVLTVGNGLIDAFLAIHDANEHIHLDKQTNEFRLKAGEKIQLDSCVFELGGNACNVAVGLSRLGLKTGLLAEIGEDEFSEKIINRLKKENVDTSLIQRKGESSFAIGLNFQGERTLFIEHVEREHAFSFSDVSSHAMYLTSIGQQWHHVYQKARDYARSHSVFFALNPGTMQLREGGGFLRELLPYTDVLFINKEEGFRLIGQATAGQDIRVLLRALIELGVHTVVVTDGEQGSFVTDPQGKIYHAPVSEAAIVERTGAGDAYATGFIAALLSGRDVTEAMQWGSLNAASVIGKVGAQPGLLRTQDMAAQLESEKRLVVEEM